VTESHQPPPNQRDQGLRSNKDDWVPRPDPTTLTTAALEREISHLRELLGGRVEEIAKDFDRFKEAHGNRHADAVDKAIEHLSELCDVKFSGIQQQFSDRDIRFEHRDVAAREAIQAALASAEKAVAKSEATFTKEIDSIKELISTTAKAQDQQIRDIKDEQTGSRGKGAGLSQAWGIATAAVTVLIGIVSVAVIIASR
jgi:hypothetical protein